jgi:hypothetical protein
MSYPIVGAVKKQENMENPPLRLKAFWPLINSIIYPDLETAG